MLFRKLKTLLFVNVILMNMDQRHHIARTSQTVVRKCHPVVWDILLWDSTIVNKCRFLFDTVGGWYSLKWSEGTKTGEIRSLYHIGWNLLHDDLTPVTNLIKDPACMLILQMTQLPISFLSTLSLKAIRVHIACSVKWSITENYSTPGMLSLI